jgi:predicted aldo/keto reductase-like oxidoreductase
MAHDRRTTRRDFVIEGSAGIAGAAVLSVCPGVTRSRESEARLGRSVVRTLGRTGLDLPVVSMGSSYGIGLVEAALVEGIRCIHTSSSYQEKQHESMLGEIFKKRPRSSFAVGTSPDLPYSFRRFRDRSADLGTEVDPALIGRSLEDSLRRLHVDFVDFYYLCSVGTREVRFEPYLEAFSRLKKEGKARAIGIGTHENEPDVIRAAVGGGIWDVVLTAYNFRQAHREAVRAAIREAAEAGLGVIVMKTQAGVYRDRSRTELINQTAALKWVLQDENVHTTIPAFSNFDELREDISVMKDLEFTPAEARDLEEIERSAHAGLFFQQCGHCLPQCPHNVEIPTLMRDHMYAVGHAQPGKAVSTLRGIAAGEIRCVDCRRCTVQCALGLDIQPQAAAMCQLLESSTFTVAPLS